MRFESYNEKLLPSNQYRIRLFRHATFGAVFLFLSLLLGMMGYHYVVGLNGIDSFLSASMILTGMGPIDNVKEVTSAGKLFEGCYAIYSGVSFITTVGFILAPIAHRILHKFHLDEED